MTGNKKRVWTAEEWATLQRMRAGGEKWEAIDKALGREPKSSRAKWENERAKERIRANKAAPALKPAPAEHSSLTAAFFGDPLPGRSALDQQRAGIGAANYFDRRTMNAPKKPTLYTGAPR